MLPDTADRVPAHTSARINAWIRHETDDRIAWFAHNPHYIDDRLAELDAEWDIERALEANASSLALLGLTMALTLDRRWLALPVGVAAFLLQHALQGWCPPVPVLRRLGLRTAREIEEERHALKALRGDYALVDSGPEPLTRAWRAIEAVRH